MTGSKRMYTLIVTCILFVCGFVSGELNIISRSEWGARRPSEALPPLSRRPVPYVVIHHSDSASCTTQAVCQLRVRGFQNHHMNVKQWADIGYNFIVGEDGNVYEGRGWDTKGSHSVPFNARSIGICLIGNFKSHTPNAAATQATAQLISKGIELNKIRPDYKLLGHRQTARTDCPGNSLYSLIQTWPHWSQNAK